MADTLATKNTLDGLHKTVYEDGLENLPYGNFIGQQYFKFRSSKRTGKNFQFPVVPTMEQGFVYGQSGTTMSLPDSIANNVVMGTATPHQGLLKSVMDLEVAYSAAGGEESYRNSTQFLFEEMLRSHRKRLELDIWYGATDLALVDSIATKVITVQTAEWAAGIFAGAENAQVEIFSSDLATKRNDGGSNSVFKITAVDLDARTITVEAVTGGAAPDSVVSGDRIFFKTQVTGAGGSHNSMKGVQAIQEATTNFGISNATYNLLQAGTKAISPAANLSLDNIFDATAVGQARGMDGEVHLCVNSQTWRKLLTDQSALRQYDASFTTNALRNGAQELAFWAATGRIVVHGSQYIKEGFGFMVQPSKFFRVGPTEITFALPGLADQMWDLDSSLVAFRTQTYHSQVLVTPNPGHSVLISGISNA